LTFSNVNGRVRERALRRLTNLGRLCRNSTEVDLCEGFVQFYCSINLEKYNISPWVAEYILRYAVCCTFLTNLNV
jgi:hypothetical protein